MADDSLRQKSVSADGGNLDAEAGPSTDALQHIASLQEPEKVPAGAWWMLFILFILYVYSLFDRLILTMLVEPIKQDLGLTDVQISIILGPAFAVFYALFGWPLGWAADRYPRRWVIFLGVAFSSVAATLAGLARSLSMLLVCRIGVGIGDASLTPAAYSLMGDMFPRRRMTTAMSIYQTGSMVGTAAAFAVGAVAIQFASGISETSFPFVGQLNPWQITLLMTAAPGIVLAFFVFTFSEPARRQFTQRADAVPRQTFIRFVRNEWKLLLPMALGFSLMVMLGNSLIAWTPTYLTREFGWGPAQYGWILGVVSLASGLTMVMKGWLVDWLYAGGMRDAHLRFYSWLVVAALPVSIAAFLVTDPLMFLILYGVLQVLVIQFVVYVAATVHLVTPTELRAQTIAVFISVFSLLGTGLGPLITAMITDLILKDPARIGTSLLIVASITLPLAWLSLQFALKAVNAAMKRQESLDEG